MRDAHSAVRTEADEAKGNSDAELGGGPPRPATVTAVERGVASTTVTIEPALRNLHQVLYE